MPTPPDDPRGRELLILIERLKYQRHLDREVAGLLDQLFTQVVDTMLSPSFRDLTAVQRQRLAAMLREIDQRISTGYKGVATFQRKEMTEYAGLEATLARNLVGVESAKPYLLPKSFLESVATLPAQGLNIGQWFDTQAASMSTVTRRTIQHGLIEGIGPAALARKIIAPLRAEGPVVARRARAEALAVSRTITTAVQNAAQLKALSSLPPSVSERYVYEAVLDGRTTAICRALSGRVYRYDDPKRKVPPQHVGCRSSIRPLLANSDEAMTDQAEPRTLKNYDTWLRTQSVSEQNEILGRTRAEYWREGLMTLADAITQDNRILTLPQLRARLNIRDQ